MVTMVDIRPQYCTATLQSSQQQCQDLEMMRLYIFVFSKRRPKKKERPPKRGDDYCITECLQCSLYTCLYVCACVS